MSALSAFKAAARAAILAIPETPEGFGYGDVASLLGADYLHPGKAEKQLRRFLAACVEKGALRRVGRGRYVTTAKCAEECALGVGVELEGAIYQAFYDAGGVLAFGDLLAMVGRAEQGQDRHVRRLLEASPRYCSALRIAGFRQYWRLIDAERLRVPLPGHLLALELKLAAGGRPVKDLPARLRRRRAQIASALKEARELRGISVEELVARPAVANALRWDLQSSLIDCDVNGGRGTLADWWGAASAGGCERALMAAWEALESASEGKGVHDPHLRAVSVRFWTAVGEAFSVCPAYLSRGVAVPLRPASQNETDQNRA